MFTWSLSRSTAGTYSPNVPSYFAASCGSAPLDVTRKEVEDQHATPKPPEHSYALYPLPEGRGFTANWIIEVVI